MADIFPQNQTHNHDGRNSPRINPVNLERMPFIKSEIKFTFVPQATNAYIRWKTSDNTYYLAIYINSTWVEVQLS